MAEDLWKPKFDTQAAYLTPALANYSDGPCGFKFNPGAALSEGESEDECSSAFNIDGSLLRGGPRQFYAD